MTKQYIGRIKPRGCSFKISFGYSTYCAMCICPSNCYGFSIGSMWTMIENWCNTHLNATFFRLCHCFPFFSCCKLLCRFLFWVRVEQPKTNGVYLIPSFGLAPFLFQYIFAWDVHTWHRFCSFLLLLFSITSIMHIETCTKYNLFATI